MRAIELIIAGLTIAAIAAIVAAGPAAAGDTSKSVIGTWQLTRGVVGGTAMPDAAVKKLRLELTEGKYNLVGAESPDRGTWKLHPGTKPLALDIHGTDGPNKGKTYLTIVKVAGDKLTVCYDLSGKSRPASFESKPKTLLFLAEYERVKQ